MRAGSPFLWRRNCARPHLSGCNCGLYGRLHRLRTRVSQAEGHEVMTFGNRRSADYLCTSPRVLILRAVESGAVLAMTASGWFQFFCTGDLSHYQAHGNLHGPRFQSREDLSNIPSDRRYHFFRNAGLAALTRGG